MAEVTVTTEQVHELILQLAAMNVAASITPEMVANIFENMRQLNDQERPKVIATAEAYIQQITDLAAEILNETIDITRLFDGQKLVDRPVEDFYFEKSELVYGSVQAVGTVSSSDKRLTTPEINVPGGIKITLPTSMTRNNVSYGVYVRVVGYDRNGDSLGSIDGTNGWVVKQKVAIPTNCSYVRISFGLSANGTDYLEDPDLLDDYVNGDFFVKFDGHPNLIINVSAIKQEVEDLKNGGITSAMLSNGAVTSAKIKSKSVTDDKIAYKAYICNDYTDFDFYRAKQVPSSTSLDRPVYVLPLTDQSAIKTIAMKIAQQSFNVKMIVSVCTDFSINATTSVIGFTNELKLSDSTWANSVDFSVSTDFSAYNYLVVRFNNAVSDAQKTLIEANGIDLSMAGSLFETVEQLERKSGGSLITMKDIENLLDNEGFLKETVSFSIPNSGNCNPILITSRASFEGATAPTISYTVGVYNSIPFEIGSAEDLLVQQWRVPPIMGNMPNAIITITVPTGSKLKIDSFTTEYCSNIPKNGITRINSHLGFLAYAPEQTLASIEAAAIMGYQRCIVNPIRTSDGVWMCYHGGKDYLSSDGTKANAIAIADEDFKNYSYSQIRAYEIVTSNSMHNYWKGCKVPTLEEVFALMARTGMHPIFSVHPMPDASEWNEIKALLVKYELLNKLTIKVFSVASFIAVKEIFGNSIECYIVITYETTLAAVELVCDSFNNNKGNIKVRLGVELGTTSTYTEEFISAIINKGFYPTVESYSGRVANGAAFKQLMSYGATDFTDDINPNCGLNW